ncbi:UPF0481 protein At3g47200-like isoform X1 [Castanea sativa]|uniref:UPF0481 protein At3g47200-like isoform X1 n=1 Tax=Castanea sativa TaxID=21020 RepID=UPI003F64AB16
MATGATEKGGSSTATEIGNLEMSTKSNIIPDILPTSEIGGSSTANEDEILVNDIREMFAMAKQDISTGSLGLISVPHHLRKLDEQPFTPLLISIGPIHRSNPNLQTMQRTKVQVCERFLEEAKMDLKNFVECGGSWENEIRSCYEETIVSSISRNDFVKMILVDGMFILGYFLYFIPPIKFLGVDGKMPEWMLTILKADLVLLENQLPFFVLERLIQKANLGNRSTLMELAFDFFQCYNFQNMAFQELDSEIEHFTDLVRLFYLGKCEDLPERSSGGAKLAYSATQLHEAGVKFEKATKRYRRNRGFLDLRFDSKNGVLEIPCITLNDEKIRLIRNISALEQSSFVGHTYVTDFFVILDFLINTSKDVDLLCDKGILVNYLGDSKAAATVVNSLNTNILWDYMNPRYSKICEDLNAFYKKRWHRWRATLCRQYFSTPWRAASTNAAIILLVLTAIQTVCSLKSTKW